MTTLRCARCKRPLLAVTIQISGCNYGPKCLERMGIATTKTRRQAKAQRARAKNVDQLDLPLEVANVV